MKKIISGTLIGLLISIAIFLPFLFQAAELDLDMLLTLSFALHYVSLFFKIGNLLLLTNLTSLIGLLILMVPIALGFSIGLWLKVRKMGRY